MHVPDQIVHVRARGPSPSRRVRTALGQARLSPPDLSPSAVLLVHRLDDPLPGALQRGARLPPRWERAARDAIAEHHHRAVRPRGGRVPPNADAVLFADEAEWRAAAALAIARSLRPWWTRSLGPVLVPALLAETPRLLPAVLTHLAAWSEAATVLAHVAAPEADAMTEAACDAASVPRPSVQYADVAGRLGAALPWEPSLPLAQSVADVEEQIGRAQAVLLGVCGVLSGSADRLRRPEAVAAVAAWRAQDARALSPTDALRVSDREVPPEVADTSASDAPPHARVSVSPAPQPATAPPPRTRPHTGEPTRFAPDPLAPSHADLTPFGTPSPPSPEAAPADAEPGIGGTATRLGGVFYLLPVMRSFEWPEAEEEAWQLDSTTGTWGVLEALARGLLGATHDPDPLWRLLAHLDARAPGVLPRDAVAPDDQALGASVPGLPRALGAWTQTVLPSVTSRLREALDLEEASRIPDALLLREATVFATRSHVDVVFPLASATLAVRRAGLDADPGWMPSVGRVVQFHYR